MVSIEKQFLFIHVPKTGGNSIQSLLKYYSEDDIVSLADHHDGLNRFEVRNRKYKITKHATLRHYKNALDSGTYKSLFKFAVIRNPWDRMISLYFSPHRGLTDFNKKKFIALVKNTATLRKYICQRPFLKIIGSEIIEDIDYLMRFERLDDDFEVLSDKLGIPYSSLPRINNSHHHHYSEYYDDELIAHIGNKFKEEVELGHYSFARLRNGWVGDR